MTQILEHSILQSVKTCNIDHEIIMDFNKQMKKCLAEKKKSATPILTFSFWVFFVLPEGYALSLELLSFFFPLKMFSLYKKPTEITGQKFL